MSEPRHPTVCVGTSAEDADLVAGELWALGARGIEERDATTLNRGDVANGAVTLVASFDELEAAHAAAAALGPGCGARVELVIGEAWLERWKEFFQPFRIGARLVVEPTWRAAERRPGDVIVTVDPGHAFGTGQHESTRLLLGEIEPRVEPGTSVLDVGCGSGILAIAALRLGAARACAIDVDPDAVRATIENAQRNGVADRIEVSDAPVERVEGEFALVLANIDERALVALAPALASRVAPGGLLLLSGILVEAEGRVREAYAGLSLVAAPREGEWLALVLRAERSEA